MKGFITLIMCFALGIVIGVHMMYEEVFKSKIPLWVCWIICILSIPVNLIYMLIEKLFHKQEYAEVMEEIRQDVIDKLEEAE